MKRILFTLFIILPIALTACSGGSHTPDSAFAGEMQATDGSANYTASVDADGDRMTLTFHAPESVAGLRFTFTNGELHTSLNGLDCITDSESLPQASIPAVMHAVFSEAENAVFQSSDDGKDLFTVGSATVTAKDGVPERIASGSLVIMLRKS